MGLDSAASSSPLLERCTKDMIVGKISLSDDRIILAQGIRQCSLSERHTKLSIASACESIRWVFLKALSAISIASFVLFSHSMSGNFGRHRGIGGYGREVIDASAFADRNISLTMAWNSIPHPAYLWISTIIPSPGASQRRTWNFKHSAFDPVARAYGGG
jgi:hypothetical protein